MSREEYLKREAAYAMCRSFVTRAALSAVTTKPTRVGDDPVILAGMAMGLLVQLSEQLSDIAALLTPGMADAVPPAMFGLDNGKK